jgi:hypothetical protein
MAAKHRKEFPMSKKPGLTLKQHEKLGLELQAINEKLIKISSQLREAYPQKISEIAYKAVKAVGHLRCVLDDKVCGENWGFEGATRIYYGANRPDRKA